MLTNIPIYHAQTMSPDEPGKSVVCFLLSMCLLPVAISSDIVSLYITIYHCVSVQLIQYFLPLDTV